jgi:hypothetical protein
LLARLAVRRVGTARIVERKARNVKSGLMICILSERE